MSTILKYPRGLSAALSLRAGGQTPSELADVIAGTFDLKEMFLLDTREQIVSNINAAPAVGVNAYGGAAPGDMAVPPGELWYVWHYTAIGAPGAGAAIDLCAAAAIDGASTTFPVGDYASAAATQQVRARASQPFWAGPGSTLLFLVRSVTLAQNVQGVALITRLRI